MTFGSFLVELNSEIYQILKMKLGIIPKIFLVILRILARISYALGRHSPKSIRRKQRVDDRTSLLEFVQCIKSKISLSPTNNAVVIPAYIRNDQEVKQLHRAVLSVCKQVDLVLIIDDASPIPFKEDSFIFRLKENSGPAAARNIGLEICKMLGSINYILFLDADCIADKNWASSMIRRLQKDSIAVGGITKAIKKDSVSLYHDLFGTLNGRLLWKSKQELLYAPTCNFGINLKCGIKFDERFPDSAYEDIDFCIKLRQSNSRLDFEPCAIMHHDYDTTLMGFCKQFRKYGMSEWLILDNHPDYFKWLSESTDIPSINI